MPEILKDALAPALALLGTLLVAFLGYRQWKKQQDTAKYGGYLSERQAAYKELWQRLEEVHLYVRSVSFEEDHFHELVRSANVHVIKAGLYLDSGEKKLANEYLKALGNLGRLLAKSSETQAKSEAERELHATDFISRDVLAQVKGLHGAYTDVEQRREKLVVRFRKVLGADRL